MKPTLGRASSGDLMSSLRSALALAVAALGHRKTKILGGYGEYALAIETQLGLMPKNIGAPI